MKVWVSIFACHLFSQLSTAPLLSPREIFNLAEICFTQRTQGSRGRREMLREAVVGFCKRSSGDEPTTR